MRSKKGCIQNTMKTATGEPLTRKIAVNPRFWWPVYLALLFS